MNIISHLKRYLNKYECGLPPNGWMGDCIDVTKAELEDTELFPYIDKVTCEIKFYTFYNLEEKFKNIQIFILYRPSDNVLVIGKAFNRRIILNSIILETMDVNF